MAAKKNNLSAVVAFLNIGFLSKVGIKYPGGLLNSIYNEKCILPFQNKLELILLQLTFERILCVSRGKYLFPN